MNNYNSNKQKYIISGLLIIVCLFICFGVDFLFSKFTVKIAIGFIKLYMALTSGFLLGFLSNVIDGKK